MSIAAKRLYAPGYHVVRRYRLRPRRLWVWWEPSYPRKRALPTNFWPMSIVAKRLDGWRHHCTEVDFGPGHIVLDGVAALPKRGTAAPLFGPCLLWPQSPISATADLRSLLCKLRLSGEGLSRYSCSIRWQDSAPPISGYWPPSEPNAG